MYCLDSFRLPGVTIAVAINHAFFSSTPPPPPENNNLHGSIPSEIHHMYYLKNINLSKNPQLGGQVPREIESLSHLEGLSIRSTIVIGSIEFLCTNNNARNLQSSYYTVDHEEGLLSTTSCPKGHCWEADLSRVECSCCD